MTGPAVVTGTGVLTGQGIYPIARARYSTDAASVTNPAWTELTNIQFRGFSVSRGRESTLSEFDAGNASIRLDNRDRTFDPTSNALIRPMNRWWLYEEFSGEVHDLFKGYAESYDNTWPGGGWSDAECVVNCADEFKVLSLAALPTTNPPRDTYTDLVASDGPQGYYAMNEDPAGRQRIDLAVTIVDPNPPREPGLRRVDRRKAPGRPRKH